MALVDEKINEWQKELNKIEIALDKNPDDEELKRQKKNVKERIRVRTQKLMEDFDNNRMADTLKFDEAVEKTKTKIVKLVAEELKKGLKTTEIAKKYNLKSRTVSWYKWKLNQK